MLRKKILAAAVAAAFVVPASVFAADDAEIKKVREEIETIKDDYETRVRQLEQRLEKAEQGAGTARPAVPAQSAPASANAFNPAISLILGGQFNNLQRDPETYQIGGFIPGGDEIGPGKLNCRRISGTRRRDGMHTTADRTTLHEGLKHKRFSTPLAIMRKGAG